MNKNQIEQSRNVRVLPVPTVFDPADDATVYVELTCGHKKTVKIKDLARAEQKCTYCNPPKKVSKEKTSRFDRIAAEQILENTSKEILKEFVMHHIEKNPRAAGKLLEDLTLRR